ncbi:hypothetical protein SBBP1_110084 [Burkholderiales bacterium]|nr:hypothetical protein SBBP1_110084 [Burkholderiales bacterium]
MSEVATPNAGDRSFDLSLRLLTVLVLIALAGSVSFLAYRLLAPRFSQNDNERVTTTTSRPPVAPATTVAGPAHGDEVLMDPGRVFRCEEQGRVSFSDQACPNSTPTDDAAGRSRPARGAH